jgi:hypothetical protein
VNITSANVTPAAWHHFAVVRSGTTLSLYVDGVLAGSDAAFSLDFTNANPVKWGGSFATSVLDRWLNGSLADLAIFTGALSGAEVSRLTSTPVQWFGGQSATATVNVHVLAPLDSWRLQHFGTTDSTGLFADTADKDRDGLSNLLEYGTAANPNAPNQLAATTAMNSGNLEFTYTRNKAATDVSFIVEWSDTLGSNSWSSAGVASVIQSDNGMTQQIKATVPAGAGGKRFVRLRVTRP